MHNDRIWKHCKNQARHGSWVKYVFSLMPEKIIIIIKLCSASRMTFRAWFSLKNRTSKYWKTIRNTFGLFEKHFSKANEPKKAPKYISDRKGSGLFLRNENQLISWRLRFQAWLNLYIISFTVYCSFCVFCILLLLFDFFFFFSVHSFVYIKLI